MAIQNPISDLARSKQHNPDETWPESVQLAVMWRDKNGNPLTRIEDISADQFFGRGGFGAPLTGEHLIMAIERMRRAGPPVPIKPKRKVTK
jgi:hypothetical protein